MESSGCLPGTRVHMHTPPHMYTTLFLLTRTPLLEMFYDRSSTFIRSLTHLGWKMVEIKKNLNAKSTLKIRDHLIHT